MDLNYKYKNGGVNSYYVRFISIDQLWQELCYATVVNNKILQSICRILSDNVNQSCYEH